MAKEDDRDAEQRVHEGRRLARRRRLGTASSHKLLKLDGLGKYGDKTEPPAP
jgi:hypothetical protein